MRKSGRRLKERLTRWYQGEFVPFQNEPHSRVLLIGGTYRRHWTARVLRSAIEFLKRKEVIVALFGALAGAIFTAIIV